MGWIAKLATYVVKHPVIVEVIKTIVREVIKEDGEKK